MNFNLIFIISQPRSGSTLLQALLSNNNEVATVSEPWLLLPFLSYNRPDLIEAKFNSQLASEGLNDFKDKIGHEFFKEDLRQFFLKSYQRIISMDEKYVLDKTPRYYEIIDEIVELYPESKVIVLRRNPLAVLNSIVKTWDRNDINKLLEFKRDLLVAPLKLKEFSERHNDNPNIKTIFYEDLVKEPANLIHDIYKWLGIDFNHEILNYRENKKFLGAMGDPVGIHSLSTPAPSSLDKWKNLLLDKNWKLFCQGYLSFLKSKDFETERFDFDFELIPTKVFNTYLERSNWEFLEHEVPKKKIIKYAILRRLGLRNF